MKAGPMMTVGKLEDTANYLRAPKWWKRANNGEN
jgi:hypothetical protein